MTALETLIHNSPYLRQYQGKVVVIKFGGNALADAPDALASFALDIALLQRAGVRPVVVHGGGPQIDAMLDKLGIVTTRVRGMRVTSPQAMAVAEMVLCGVIGPEIVSAISAHGLLTTGVSGKDSNLIEVKKLAGEVDYQRVGEITRVNPELLHKFLAAGIIPVVTCIGTGPNGESYNINADTAAGAIAGALGAHRFMLLTNVAGVLDGDKNLIAELTPARAAELIADGTIAGGMIPKVETCLLALSHGAAGAVIMDGRAPHAALYELFTDTGSGTLVRN
jgi:acetylglutamate kinase